MIIKSAEFFTSGGRRSEYPRDGKPQFAFAGRSNVGKSSLINKLVNRRKLVQTSRTPGRTRRVNFFIVNDDLYFVDLPGYGYANVPLEEQERWRPMIDAYLRGNPDLRIVFVLLDARHDPTKLDLQLIDYLASERMPFRVILTKIDKLKSNQRAKTLASHRKRLAPYGVKTPIAFSAKTGEGRDAILEIVEGAFASGETK